MEPKTGPFEEMGASMLVCDMASIIGFSILGLRFLLCLFKLFILFVVVGADEASSLLEVCTSH